MQIPRVGSQWAKCWTILGAFCIILLAFSWVIWRQFIASGMVVDYEKMGTWVGTAERPTTSRQLQQDIKLMWETEHDIAETKSVATEAACAAAERVFDAIDLIGVTRDDLAEKLRFDLRDPDYGYSQPFFPVSADVFVIRIDTGVSGWQFNMYFADAKVEKILRLRIY